MIFIHFFFEFANNSSMNIYLIITAILIIIITANILITVRFKYDVFNNIGNIQLKIFGVQLFKSDITVSGDYLNLSKKKNKIIKIKIDIHDQNVQFMQDFQKNIQKKIYPLKINADLNMCYTTPFTVSILSSFINILLSVFYTKFQTLHHDVTLTKNIKTGFRHDLILIDLTFSFSLSLYDLFWAYYKALKAKRRRLHEKKEVVAK